MMIAESLRRGSGRLGTDVKRIMKKRTILKVMVLALAFAVAAGVFVGCVFSYDEDTDLSQVILEINPVTVTYDVPWTDDALDPDGNPVYAVNDGLDGMGRPTADIAAVRASAEFGKTSTTEIVKTVRRTHDGQAIHKAKLSNGKVLYVGHDADGNRFEVEEGSADWQSKCDSQRTDNRYFVEPKTGTEYRFVSPVSNGAARAAQWQRVSDGVIAYGNLDTDGTANLGNYASDAAFSADLPTVYYTEADGKFAWIEHTPVYEQATHTSKKEEFFKTTMIAYFENYASGLVDDGYKNVDDIFNRFIRTFYTGYLTRVEAEAAALSGDVVWGVTEINAVNRAIYSGVDTALTSIYAEIAADHESTVPEVTDATEPEATYPTPDQEEKEDDKDYYVWHITQTPERILGNDPLPERASFEREAMRRFVNVVEEYVEDQRALSESDREKFAAEAEEMSRIVRTNEGVGKLYASLYTYDVIRTMYGDSEEYNLLIEGYRTFLGKDIQTDVDLQKVYDDTLALQRDSFATASNYATAATGSDTLLYFANEEYFWVKHILIPFSDTQTANLAAEKLKGRSDAEIAAYRRQLGDGVQVYKHVDGRDDTSVVYTIGEAFADIYGKMSGVTANPVDAEQAFTDLIYTYNTDPGIFNNDMGYAVSATPAVKGGAAETYMIEFANEARALLGAYKEQKTLYEFKSDSPDYVPSDYDRQFMDNEVVKIGSISAPILTDYGWHIMYLSYVPQAGKIRVLNETLTPGVRKTVAEALATDTYNTQLTNLFTMTQNGIATKYAAMDGVIVPHKERFESKLNEYNEKLFEREEEEA